MDEQVRAHTAKLAMIWFLHAFIRHSATELLQIVPWQIAMETL